jgi:hypothetical protein
MDSYPYVELYDDTLWDAASALDNQQEDAA